MISPISLVAPLVYLFTKPKRVKVKLEAYTGVCTHYKVSYANSQPHNAVVVNEGTGKVVINRTRNTLSLFFNNEPIIIDRDYTSSTDVTSHEETFDHWSNEYAICNYETKSFELLEGKYLHTERDHYTITGFKLQLRTLKVKEDSTELT